MHAAQAARRSSQASISTSPQIFESIAESGSVVTSHGFASHLAKHSAGQLMLTGALSIGALLIGVPHALRIEHATNSKRILGNVVMKGTLQGIEVDGGILLALQGLLG